MPHLPSGSAGRALAGGAVLLALSFAPSVGALGYFYSLATSPLAALWGLFLGHMHAREFKLPRLGMVLEEGLPELGLNLVLWLALLAATQLWNPSCDPWGGLAFWALGPLCSLILGWLTSVYCISLAPKARGIAVAPYSIFVFCTAFGLWRLYQAPAVFTFNPFWGYFSGPIYDEAVKVEARYLFYRAYNFSWALGLGALLRYLQTRPLGTPWLFLAIVALIPASWSATRRAQLGWTADRESLRAELSLTEKTEHFVIYYAPHSASAAQIKALAREHEFAWKRLESILGYAPPSPIESFVFSNPSQKRRLFGAGRVEVSLPWRQQIYLNHQEAPHRILHHELAHAFGRSVGDAIFGLSRRGFSINGGLIEGYATALAPRSVGDLDLHDQAAIVDQLEKRPPLSELMGPGFWRFASSRAYTTVGSFCLWFLDSYGAAALSQVYQSGGDFLAASSHSLADLETQWLDFLRKRSISPQDLAISRARFARRSVFARPCAHRIAVSLQRAEALAQSGQNKAAKALLGELCELDPGEIRHKIRLARFLSERKDFESAQTLLQETSQRPELRLRQKAELLGVAGDLAWSQGDFALAAQRYRQAIALPQPNYRKRALLLKEHAMEQPAALASIYWSYFQPSSLHEPAKTQRARRLEAALAIEKNAKQDSSGPYLAGLLWLSRNRPQAARMALEEALQRDAWPDPLLKKNALLQLRRALLLLEDIPALQATHAALLSQRPLKSGDILAHRLWSERLDHLTSLQSLSASPTAEP